VRQPPALDRVIAGRRGRSSDDERIERGLRQGLSGLDHGRHHDREHDLVVGAQEYAWHVAYGVGKCALDRFTSDAAHELREHGIAVVSIWPGLVLTERLEGAAKAGIPGLDFSKAESPRFTGRAVAALATDAEAMQFSGRAVAVRALAEHYGFKDVDGRLPGGPLEERPWRAGES
jgi:hypothetical protein